MDSPLATLRPRLDGWTPERQRAFIEALADTGGVAAAAARVGLSVTAAYRLRRHPAAADFRAAWEAAVADGWRRIEETAMERAIHGETETLTRDGEVVTRHRPCAPRLLVHLLDRAAARRAAAASAAAAAARQVDAATIARVRDEIRALAFAPAPATGVDTAGEDGADAAVAGHGDGAARPIGDDSRQASAAAPRRGNSPAAVDDAEAPALWRLQRLVEAFVDRSDASDAGDAGAACAPAGDASSASRNPAPPGENVRNPQLPKLPDRPGGAGEAGGAAGGANSAGAPA